MPRVTQFVNSRTWIQILVDLTEACALHWYVRSLSNLTLFLQQVSIRYLYGYLFDENMKFKQVFTTVTI